MKVGFLVSSISREAGGLFQSVRGLAKAVASTNANVRVFGIRDEQSAVDLQEWRPLSVADVSSATARVGLLKPARPRDARRRSRHSVRARFVEILLRRFTTLASGRQVVPM